MNAKSGHAAMLLFSLVVSLSFLIGQSVAGKIEPLAITAARFWIAVLIFAAIVAFRRDLSLVNPQYYWRYLLPGAAFAIYFVLMFEALKTANPLNIAVIFTLNPLLAAFFDRLINGHKLPLLVLVALLVGLFGTIWVIFEGDVSKLRRFQLGRGEWLFLVAAFAHALYPPLLARFSRGEPAPVVALVALSAATLLTTIVGAPAIVNTNWMALDVGVYASIIYFGVFATALSFLLVKFATTRIPSAKILAYTYIVPFWVAIEMVVLNHEALPPSAVIGGGFIGVALLMLFVNKA